MELAPSSLLELHAERTDLAERSMQDIQQAVATGISQAISSLVADLVSGTIGTAKTQLGKIKTELEIGFGKYLHRNFERCSKVKTLLHRFEPVNIEEAYVPSRIGFAKKTIEEAHFPRYLTQHRRVIISGMAGSGKSMFLKHLFVTLYKAPGDAIPIFIEMRNLNAVQIDPLSEPKEPSLIEHIRDEIGSLVRHLTIDQLEYALARGKLILMLDGIDEVDHSIRDAISKQILQIAYKFPKTQILATSRPADRFISWNEFHTGIIQPLNLEQATGLIEKIDYDPAIKGKFMEEMRTKLFETHKEFLSNPLLCTMMLLTFEEYANIPSKMHIFYDQAFNVLYNKHDATKAAFKRKFYTSLSIDDFRRLLMTFALFSFLEHRISMSENEARRYAQQACKFEALDVDPEMFINDLEESICLLLRDGDKITYLHRSFQEYFTALFLANRYFAKVGDIIASINNSLEDNNVIQLLVDINRDAFEAKFFSQALSELNIVMKRIDPLKDPKKLLGLFYSSIVLHDGKVGGLTIRQDATMRRWYPILHVLETYYDDQNRIEWFDPELFKKGILERHGVTSTKTGHNTVAISQIPGELFLEAGISGYLSRVKVSAAQVAEDIAQRAKEKQDVISQLLPQ